MISESGFKAFYIDILKTFFTLGNIKNNISS